MSKDRETNIDLTEYAIINTYCIENNWRHGQAVEIEKKLFNKLFRLKSKPMWYFISSFNHTHDPDLGEYGECTYARSELFVYARKKGWKIYRKDNITHSLTGALQHHVVIAKDKLIIKYLKNNNFKEEIKYE